MNDRVTGAGEEAPSTPIDDLALMGRLQRAATMGQLAAGLAHDLNNILTLILGPVEIARADTSLSDRTRDLLGVASDATRRATAINQSLLAFVRNEKWLLEDSCVPALVDDLRPLFRLACGSRIALDIEHRQPNATARVERHQLETVLLNLALNARDAMSEGGRMTITTDATKDEVRITVTDTGAGMDKATLARAFEPMFSTKGVGHGLGLFMVRRVIESFGGQVAIRSVPGAGTTVNLTLPSSAAAPQAG